MQAKIHMKNQMVTFIDSSIASGSGVQEQRVKMVNQLEEQCAEITSVMREVKETDFNIKKTKEYIRNTTISQTGRGGGALMAAMDDEHDFS